MTGAGETESLAAIDSVRLTGLEDGAGIIIVLDIFVEGDGDTAESVDDLDERAPVKVSIILEIHAEDIANLSHEGGGAFLFVLAVHIITPVYFVDFASSGASGGCFEVAGKRNHGNVASFLI